MAGAAKGWVYLTNPQAKSGDPTPWIASFWEFCSAYANDRYGADWNVSPEQSLLLAVEHTSIPNQLILHSQAASDTPIHLPCGNSIYNLKSQPKDADDVEVIDGIRRLTLPVALTLVPEDFFKAHSLSAQIALRQLQSPSQLLGPLLERSASVVAGRLAGAFRHVGNDRFADEVVGTMSSAQYQVREHNPFEIDDRPVTLRTENPVAGRIAALWQKSRQVVLDFSPHPRGCLITRRHTWSR